MEEKKKEPPTVVGMFVFGMCCASLIGWGGCAGIICFDNRQTEMRIEKETARLQVVIGQNDGQFKVLNSYPAYNHNGHFMNHAVVLEGVRNQARIQAPAEPTLPVPGEIWEVRVGRTNELQLYGVYLR